MLITFLRCSSFFLPRIIKRAIALSIDAVICFLSVYLAFYLRLGEWINPISPGYWRLFFVGVISIFICLPLFTFFNLYQEILRYSTRLISRALLRAIGIYSIIFIFLFVIVGFDGVPRTIGFIQPIVLLLLLASTKTILSYFFLQHEKSALKEINVKRVLIYGAGEAGRQLELALSQAPQMQVVGFLDDDRALHGKYLQGLQVFAPESLVNLTESKNIQGVLLAIPSCKRSRRAEIIDFVRSAKLSIQTLPSLNDLAQGKIIASDIKELEIGELLGRLEVAPDMELLKKNSNKSTILISGAGGSIGSELCRQLIDLDPSILILVDQSEFSLYQIHSEIERTVLFHNKTITLVPVLGSVTDTCLMKNIVSKWSPSIIYHAAAYKHVPLVELNILEGVRNNVFGTLVLANIAIECGVSNFVLISSDKAVRPTNVMGASKRIAELVLQALSVGNQGTVFSMVRFGNVLDSSGSVVPKFREQIKSGGPITLTDSRVTRYFMTIPEAAQLVIQAGALAKGGDVFLLDMGDPVKILDLALRMIDLSGLEVRNQNNPFGDIEIQEIGLRSGEKLYEELLIEGSPERTKHQRIYRAHEDFIPWEKLEISISLLKNCIASQDKKMITKILGDLVNGYQPTSLNLLN